MTQDHCRKCGETQQTTEIELERGGAVIASGVLCQGCFARACDGARRLRLIFEGLLEVGLTRVAANARVIEIIEGRGGVA